jgi:hypothetical protein
MGGDSIACLANVVRKNAVYPLIVNTVKEVSVRVVFTYQNTTVRVLISRS